MRAPRTARLAVSLLLGAGAVGGVSACAGSTPTEPSLPSVNFSPKVVIEIGTDGLHLRRGPREDPTLVLDPPSFGSGTVAEIRNASAAEQRLQGDAGKVFDTGTLRPGETTTVVFTNTTADPLHVAVTDPRDPAVHTTIEVRPASAA